MGYIMIFSKLNLPHIQKTIKRLEEMTTSKSIIQHESNKDIELTKPGVYAYSIDDASRALLSLLKLDHNLQNSRLLIYI